jgi:hypothetical protein
MVQKKSIAVVAAAVAALSFGAHAQASPEAVRKSEAVRNRAIHECNVNAGKYTSLKPVAWNAAVYRACMFDHGQLS